MKSLLKPNRKEWIKQKAIELGFSDTTFAKAEFMEEESERLKTWLNNGFQGQMDYMKTTLIREWIQVF